MKSLIINCNRILSLTTFLILTHVIHSQNSRGANPIHSSDANGTVYAMIIGISDYQKVPDLMYADMDAFSFRNYLIENQYTKCDSANIELFLNQQATKVNILDALSSMFNKTQKGDILYFYFAGHGDIEDMTQSENGLLLLHGSPDKNYFGMTDEVLQVNQMVEYFGKLQERGVDVIYIIDACHSGKLIGGSEGRIHAYNAIQNLYFGNSTLMLSCSANQLSLEGVEWGGGHGIFSYYLNQGLRGVADLNRDNTIRFEELKNYVEINTYIESEYQQTPVFRGDYNKTLSKFSDSLWKNSKLQIAQKYSEYSTINFKGKEEFYLKDCDDASQKLYYASLEQMKINNLISADQDNAYSYCQQFIYNYPNNYLSPILRRKLIAKLNQTFDSLMRPLIEGKRPKWPRALLLQARTELDSCLHLISEEHKLYQPILARKYYLDALWCSYGININNYGPLDAIQMKECIKYLHQARQLEPNAAYIYYSLGRTHQTILNSDSSLIYLEKFATLLPNSALAHNMLGISYGDINLFERSKQEFLKAIQLDSTIKESYANLIYIYSKINRHEDAIRLAKKGLRLFPDFMGLRNNLSELYLQVNMLPEAIQYIEASMKIDSLNLSNLFLKGQYYYKISEYEKAQEIFLKILEIKKDYKPAIYFLAQTYKSKRDYRKSIALIQSLLSMDADDVKSNYFLGVYYDLLGLRDSAFLQFTKILNLTSGRKEYTELLADTYYFYLNQPEQSERYYAEIIQSDSFNLELLTKYCSNLIRNNKPEKLNRYISLIKQIPNHKAHLTYIDIAQKVQQKNYQQATQKLETMLRHSRELKWHIIKDPVMYELIELPEVRELIQL